jgi:hypothetical protein
MPKTLNLNIENANNAIAPSVMAGFIPGIHDFTQHDFQVVDARDRRGHDAVGVEQSVRYNASRSQKKDWIASLCSQ